MTQSGLLRFERVAKVFEGATGEPIPAVGEVSLSVGEREIVCLTGPSGCGKSTLLMLAAGLDEPTEGMVRFGDEPVRGPDAARGLIFQTYALFPWMSARKNVEYGLKLRGVGAGERRQRALEQLRLVGLDGFADALPKQLSGGMKQRVAIARAYAVEPRLLLMDEPFGSLDAHTRAGLQHDLIQTWMRAPRAIVFVTHDVEEALMLGHRIVVLSRRPGRIRTVVTVDEPQPRTTEFRLSEEFVRRREELWRLAYDGDQ